MSTAEGSTPFPLTASAGQRFEDIWDADGLETAEQIASRLQVEPVWVRRRARRGEIPCVYVGRFPRFVWPEVLEALRGRP